MSIEYGRVVELVETLDRAVPIEGAEAIVFVDSDWTSAGATVVAFLATPTGFVRFGLALMRAALAPDLGQERRGERMPVELDDVLRQDSNLELLYERVGGTLSWPHDDEGLRTAAQDTKREEPAWAPILNDLDSLLTPAQGEVHVALEGLSEVTLRATRVGLLRLGLEFAKGSLDPSSGRGHNGGEALRLALDRLLASGAKLTFECERVEKLPEGGDRRRSKELPGCFGLLIFAALITVIVLLVRACLIRS